MKILIFGPNNIQQDQLMDFSHSTSCSFLTALQKQNVDITIDPLPFIWYQKNRFDMPPGWYANENQHDDILSYFQSLPDNHYDHIIALGHKGLTRFPKGTYDILKSKIKGSLCQFADKPVTPPFMRCDITFISRKFGNSKEVRSGRNNNIYVGWAADPNVFTPSPPAQDLVVFVDHPTYNKNNMHLDMSTQIFAELKKLVQTPTLWKSQYKNIVVKRIVNGGMELINFDTTVRVAPFNKIGMPFTEYAKELGSSHLFIPTHPESLGLSVLEAAMAGNLILHQPGFIPIDRIQTTVHVDVNFKNGNIDWENVLKKINPIQCRAKVLNNSWEHVAKQILGILS